MSDFNTSNLKAVTLTGGKTLGTNYAKPATLVVGSERIIGFRFNTRIEGRDTLAFAPYSAIVGITGEMTGTPDFESIPQVGIEGVSGVFLDGGRFVTTQEPAAVAGWAAPSIAFHTPNTEGGRDLVTVATGSVIAYIGDLRTDSEREDDAAEKRVRIDGAFIRTYGTDPETYGAAKNKQTVKGSFTCANCSRPFPSGHLPVYVRTVGIVHRDARCNNFTREGLIAWNAKAG